MVATLLGAGLPVLAQSAPDASARFEEMLDRVRKGDMSVDFQALRYAYAATGGDRAHRRALDDLLGMMFRAYKAHDFDGAIDASQKILALNYLDIDAQVICDLSYRMQSNSISAEPCHEMATRLLRSIADSGDGLAPESAYRVISTREEYSFLNAVGLKPVGRQTVTHDGRSFDVVDVADAGSGGTRTIYFALHPAPAPPP
jgi:hypothetical protein